MESIKIASKLPESLVRLVRRFHESGYQCYVVGGALRDILLGRFVSDFDLATSATPEEMMALVPHFIPTGVKHGTLTLFEGEDCYEVTTFRVDGQYLNARHPESVSFSRDIHEDLKRRDFTINALAYDIVGDSLIDDFNGQEDLKWKVLRTIGNPLERFEEDALRMMRACRFACQLGFVIEEKTFEAIQAYHRNICSISKERVREELVKMFQSPYAVEGIRLLEKSGLLEDILPEVFAMRGVEQNRFHSYDVYGHSLKTLEYLEDGDYRIKMAAFFHDIGKPASKRKVEGKEECVFYNHENIGAEMTRVILKRLKFSNDDIQQICHYVKQHMLHYTPSWTDGAVRRFINRVGETHLNNWFLLRYADRLATGMKEKEDEPLSEFKERIGKILKKRTAMTLKDLAITGIDLMEALSLKPSKKVGDILDQLLNVVLEDPSLNERNTLLKMAKEWLDKGDPHS